MRFSVELILENESIPKDKNRIILSLIKNCFNSYDQDYYKKIYEERLVKTKNFTFSTYMPNCSFQKEEIYIPSKKIIMNFSAYSKEDSIMFFNSFLSNKGKTYSIKNNSITINKVNLVREKNIDGDEVLFKTLSPIVVREHDGDNKKTLYHLLNNHTGRRVFMDNLRYQIKDTFGDRGLYDFKDFNIGVSENNKEVKVKNYGIVIPSNIGMIKVKGQPYLLDYLYKAGIGSKRSGGFGMVDIV